MEKLNWHEKLAKLDNAILECNNAAHKGKTVLNEGERAALHELAFTVAATPPPTEGATDHG